MGIIALDVVEDAWLHDEKGAIDPAFTNLGLFVKVSDPIAIKLKMAITGRGTNGREGRQLAMGLVESQ